ncbi:MAG: DNA-binding protein [Deltaproteobacteria bacterium]|nr:DNA-binding protein [Deltaproteobacteria bacterium]MDL1961057.1 DNA-binding protein [Deltaproteobacteria bacterium]
MIRRIRAINLFGTLLILFSVAGLVACSGDSSEKSGNQTAVKINALSGKVAETMNSGGYTYILLNKGGEKTWVAVPEMQVSVGEEVVLRPGIEMVNFTSSTLNRTFKRIILSAGPVSEKGEPVEKNMEIVHGDLPMGMMKAPSSGGIGISTKIEDVKVEKASGQDAYTIAEVYEKKSALCNNKVIVQGKVVKVLPEILGKNWIHLQDGSGDEKKENYDLVVTSQDLPSVGDVITVSGTLHTDKDFGAGYKYNVIVEEASITK